MPQWTLNPSPESTQHLFCQILIRYSHCTEIAIFKITTSRMFKNLKL